MIQRRLVKVNVVGIIEQGSVGNDPYRIDHDGHPYVPVGDGGIVLDLRLGDGVFDFEGDHAAPGVCLTHSIEDAAHALSAQACIGNLAEVRTGLAIGRLGAVVGKRGGGRVIVAFPQDVLRHLRPGDHVSVRSYGQGAEGPVSGVTALNITPEALKKLPITIEGSHAVVGVRSIMESRVVGNGIGRPMPMWDVDLQIGPSSTNAINLRLGDVVAIRDLDARYNAGYRRGWMSVGVVVHGGSPQPGHGPGVTIILSGSQELLGIREEGFEHRGMSEDQLFALAQEEKSL
jgi:hypothetical protein